MRPVLLGKSFRPFPDVSLHLVAFPCPFNTFYGQREQSKPPVWSHLTPCTSFPAPYQRRRVGLIPLFVGGSRPVEHPEAGLPLQAARLVAFHLPARLVVISRPLSRISPPVWSSITARLVAFRVPNYLNNKHFFGMNLELKEKLNFYAVNNLRCARS